ncbi:285_t:CDS:2 [Ambispora leptoticha]|uniref:285_t:CDS:1 n=1 Tax=Ambispora leptoticha TaxID=144679 RepID=A0A9N9DBD6_9GLOM|nr:285_t:CDS:2 [Ambispora leptoticha]
MVRPPRQMIEKTAILVIVLEGRVYAHNNIEKRNLDSKPTDCNVADSITRIINIMQENLVFMGFQAFQFLFCVNAIYNQNTIQMIAIAVINYVCALLGIGQIFETLRWRKQLKDNIDAARASCTPEQRNLPDADIISFEVPLVAVLLIFGTALGFLAFKLYQQFGWNIYKRIGADLRTQCKHRNCFLTMLIFVMLLKLDIFFMLAFSILALIVLNIKSDDPDRRLQSGAYYFHLGLTILIVIMQFLAYVSLRKEWAAGMAIFTLFCIISIIDYIILLTKSITSSVQTTWYFWVFFIIGSCILTGVTAIWSVLVMRNFNQGLKELLYKGKQDENPHSDLSMSDAGTNAGRRWAIEDDDD